MQSRQERLITENLGPVIIARNKIAQNLDLMATVSHV